MAVRNFYLTADIDGKKAKLTGGPNAKEGGMQLVLMMRTGGEIITALEVICYASEDGELTMLVMEGDQGSEVFRMEAVR